MAKTTGKASESVLKTALMTAFPFFNEDDDQNAGISYETGAGYAGNPYSDVSDVDDGNSSLVTTGRQKTDRLFIKKLPNDRFERYKIFKEMEDDPTMAAATEYHLGSALSVPSDGGLAFYLTPKTDADAEYVAALNREVVKPMAEQIMNWAYPMATYGVNYVRPYVEVGKGITHFESNWYTLPNQIREYERSGQLAGFTSEYLKQRKDGAQVRLAEPWALIPLKMPFYRPDMDVQPPNYTGEAYSLFSDEHSRLPVETQNYGTSLFHTSYEPWLMLRQSIAALGASRVNASLIDRMITAQTDGLDADRAAEYINMVADQLQQDRQQVVEKSRKTGILPTVMNTLIPVMGGSKGGLNIDTFTTDPNISHIEDILFNAKRLAASTGCDLALLGFGDLLSGGIGDGGFLRTSIQSAIRANQIRGGVAAAVKRAIDIHTIFRDGKVWLDENAPFELKFNSINTALQNEEADANESKMNRATMLATVLDMIENSPINKSGKLKHHLYTNVLDLEPELAQEVIAELAAAVSQDEAMMESLGIHDQKDMERYVKDTVLDLITNMQL